MSEGVARTGPTSAPNSLALATRMIDIRRIQKPLRKRYHQEPDAARFTYRVSARTSDPSDPLHVDARSVSHPGAGWRVSVNERVGGTGEDITPGDLLLSSLAACQALSVQMVAANLGLELEDVEVEASGDVDHRGVLLIPGAQRTGCEGISCRVRITPKSDTPKEALELLTQFADQVCAVSDNLRNPTAVETTYEFL